MASSDRKNYRLIEREDIEVDEHHRPVARPIHPSEQRSMIRRSFHKSRLLVPALVVAGLAFLAAGNTTAAPTQSAPTIPNATIKLGIGPYVDHAYWIVGAKKGWFKEAGITLSPSPAGKSSQPEHWGPVLISKSVEIQSSSEAHYIGSLKSARNLTQLVWTDLFQGFAILVQPDEHLTSASEFIAKGLKPDAAIRKAVGQLRGKTFLYPSEQGIQGFVDTVFAKAGMSLKDVKGQVVDDPKQVPLMLTHRADAQVSGVPIRLTLEAKGFKVLVSAADLVKAARPSVNSAELLSVFRDGAATTKEWYTANTDAALRFASVVYRICDFIKRQPTAAAKIEGPFVNSIAGTKLTTKDVLIAYNSLDPFYTFDEQRRWYTDPKSPFYYKYEIGAYIKLWEKKGLFKPGEVKVDDIATNAVIYKKLDSYRKQADALIKKTAPRVAGRGDAAAKMLAAAKTYYAHFNYLDAWRFAQAAAKAA